MVKLFKLLATKKPKVGNTLFIAVDGHGGSGKSTLAEWLSQKLSATLIHTDDFASWDNPLNWWPMVIEQVFTPIAKGATTLAYPRSQWWEGHQRDPIINQPVTNLMILEGVSSLRKEFQDYICCGIFVNTSKEICLQRGIERDLKMGKSKEELEKQWNLWFEEEDAYLQRDNPQAYADIVIDGARPFEEQIEI